jgi:DNA-binding transcriptional MocR family regulator
MPEPTSMLHLSAMTAGDDGLLKYQRVAAAVRGQIADGTLRPGQPAPSGAELSRLTGYSTLTCRRALRELIADGVLTPGPERAVGNLAAHGRRRPLVLQHALICGHGVEVEHARGLGH